MTDVRIMRSERLFRVLLLPFAAIIGGQFVWLVLKIGGEFATTAFTDILGIPCAIGAGLVCASAARRESSRTRGAWLLMGAAMASWGIGEVVWTYYEVVLGVEVPYPGWADVGYLMLIPLGAAGLLLYPSAPRGWATSVRAVLDGMIIAGSILFVGWATVLGPMIQGRSGTVLEQTLTLAYPLGDMTMIAVALYVLSRARGSGRFRLGLIAGGLLSIAFADVSFSYLTLHDAYAAGSLIDPAWNAGFLLVALAAVRREEISAEGSQDARRTGPAAILGPYVPFLAASGVAMVVQVTRGALTPFLFWNAISVVLAVAARQMLALYDNLSLNRDLETRVRERTVDLETANAELAESQRLQDEFVANTSHELRTPLTVILGALETMCTGMIEVPDECKELTTMAQRSAIRLQHLIEDLLLTSGLEGAITCRRDRFDVQAELRAVIGRLDSNDKVVATRLRQPVFAIGDPDRFKVVMNHLLSNAEKFAPAGTVISVDGYTEDGKVHAVVADQGPGVPAERHEAIFRRFYQIDGSSTRAHGGMGLGLFMARQIVSAMGGEICIDETDSGASFRVTLAAAPADDDSAFGMSGAAAL